jgi:hypothetical protein
MKSKTIEKIVPCPKYGATVSIEKCTKCRYFDGYRGEYVVCNWGIEIRKICYEVVE